SGTPSRQHSSIIFEANGYVLLETGGRIRQATPWTFGTYTLLETSTNRVLHTELVK
ncbi:hypothetical protein IscW_ISCW002149, partial [Ixodes scapularis]